MAELSDQQAHLLGFCCRAGAIAAPGPCHRHAPLVDEDLVDEGRAELDGWLLDEDLAERRAEEAIAELDARRRGPRCRRPLDELVEELERHVHGKWTLQRIGRDDYAVRTRTEAGFGQSAADALQHLLDKLAPNAQHAS